MMRTTHRDCGCGIGRVKWAAYAGYRVQPEVRRGFVRGFDGTGRNPRDLEHIFFVRRGLKHCDMLSVAPLDHLGHIEPRPFHKLVTIGKALTVYLSRSNRYPERRYRGFATSHDVSETVPQRFGWFGLVVIIIIIITSFELQRFPVVVPPIYRQRRQLELDGPWFHDLEPPRYQRRPFESRNHLLGVCDFVVTVDEPYLVFRESVPFPE